MFFCVVCTLSDLFNYTVQYTLNYKEDSRIGFVIYEWIDLTKLFEAK